MSASSRQNFPIAWPVALGSGGETLEDPDQTPLMRAAVSRRRENCKTILSAGPDASINSLDQGGQSALILACQNIKANPEVVKALLAARANVNLRSRNGYTALTWAQVRNIRSRPPSEAGWRPSLSLSSLTA